MNIHFLEIEVVDKLFTILSDKIDSRIDIMREETFHDLFNIEIRADIVLSYRGQILAAFEIKKMPEVWAMRFSRETIYQTAFTMYKIPLFIVCDDKKYYICNHKYEEKSLDEIVALVEMKIPSLNEIPTDEEVKSFISKKMKDITFANKNRIENFFNVNENLYKFDKDSGVIKFTDEQTEDAFFSTLISTQIPDVLCRYTNRHNLFLMLNEKKQNMCSVVCMNDRGECDYTDKWLKYEDALNEENNSFILSLIPGNKEDDLTMWRLYGDDARGVCLVYKIKGELSNGKFNSKGFYLAPVSYGTSVDSHPELELVQSMAGLSIRGWNFKFERWSIWKHFFKSYRFSDEGEIRLLYIGNIDKWKWIENPDSGIVSKMALHDIMDEKSFPLQLIRVRVGLKSPDPLAISKQFQFMANQVFNDGEKVYVNRSRIREYR